jgi:hypothetical protein
MQSLSLIVVLLSEWQKKVLPVLANRREKSGFKKKRGLLYLLLFLVPPYSNSIGTASSTTPPLRATSACTARARPSWRPPRTTGRPTSLCWRPTETPWPPPAPSTRAAIQRRGSIFVAKFNSLAT